MNTSPSTNLGPVGPIDVFRVLSDYEFLDSLCIIVIGSNKTEFRIPYATKESYLEKIDGYPIYYSDDWHGNESIIIADKITNGGYKTMLVVDKDTIELYSVKAP